MRMLVVEDEKRLANFIRKGLIEQKYSVDMTHDGESAEYLALTNDYDLIILDILLPKRNGWEVLQNLRQSGLEIPVILLTALSDVSNRIRGLEEGADDYITKPFAIRELVARVNALLRRAYRLSQSSIKIGDLELDFKARKVYQSDQEIQLTNKEFALLEYLLANKNKVVTRTMIAEHVWDIHFDTGSNVIDVVINFLRKKIESNNGKKLIHTVRGMGYIIKDE